MRHQRISTFAAICPILLIGLSTLAAKPSSTTPGTEADRLNQQVTQLYKAGKYSDAIPIATRVLELREKRLGLDNPYTAESFNDLGELYVKIGDYDKAEPLFQQALKIREKVLGPEQPPTAQTLNNLAALYRETRDYAKAEPLFQRAVEIDEKTLGPNHPDTAKSLINLARLYREMGDYAKAEPLYQRAVRIDEKVLGPEHPDTATSLNKLAFLYEKMGDYAKAEPLYQRVLTIREKTLGPRDPYTAGTLQQLAWFYRRRGDYAKAAALERRTLKIRQKTLGPENPKTAQSLSDLAFLCYDRAFGPDTLGSIRIFSDLRSSATTPWRTEKAVKQVYLDEALRLAEQARLAQEKVLSNILSFTSEDERLAFQRTIHPYDLLATLGNARELAESVLRQKGVVLDSLLEDRLVAEASEDPKQHAAVNELRNAKQRFMQLQLETPKDFSDEALEKRDAEKKKLSDRVEELEAGLAKQVAGLGRVRRALSVTVSQVQSALSKDETLVEVLHYSYYRGGKFAAHFEKQYHYYRSSGSSYRSSVSSLYFPDTRFEARYGAVVIASDHEPKWVPLGRATEIEKNISLYQKSVRGKTDEATLSGVLRALYAQIWTPIEKALPAETKTVIISPDSALNFVSFATLIGSDDKFLAEKYFIRYVASGRDLLRLTKAAVNKQTTVYANPDFGSKSASPDSNRGTAVALRSIEMRDLQSISLPPLPGTAREAAALEKRGGTSTKVFVGANATEAQLRQVNSPQVLYLATHGFFLPEVDLGKSNDPSQSDQEIPKSKLVNPMHRSGLALAGAQTTLQAWGRGEVPPTENDGIVTAEEVGGLKLDDTWLVVLSACDTGSGEARAGEGVMGLRRGFVEAGAQNLLMTLWPISDQTTVQIMLAFYDAAEKTHNAPQALADVQRDWLVKLRKEHGLLEAVRLAGPFIMSSQGKPR